MGRTAEFYKDVGLIADPNKLFSQRKKRKPIAKKQKKEQEPSEFVRKLEKEASKPVKKKFKFSKVMCDDLEYYINKYGEDYESMARDKKNIYQDSPGQLRYKIKKYIKIHKSE